MMAQLPTTLNDRSSLEVATQDNDVRNPDQNKADSGLSSAERRIETLLKLAHGLQIDLRHPVSETRRYDSRIGGDLKVGPPIHDTQFGGPAGRTKGGVPAERGRRSIAFRESYAQ